MVIFEIGKRPRQPIPQDIRAKVIERQANMCIVCSGQCTEIHHGVAFSRQLHTIGEDSNSLSEFVAACTPCHKRRLDPFATKKGLGLRQTLRHAGVPYTERIDSQGIPYVVHPKTPLHI